MVQMEWVLGGAGSGLAAPRSGREARYAAAYAPIVVNGRATAAVRWSQCWRWEAPALGLGGQLLPEKMGFENT